MTASLLPALTRLRDGESEVVLDESLSPILVVTFFGEVTVGIVGPFNAWMDERIAAARARGTRLALVADAAECERPGPEARRRFTEHVHDNEILVASPCVIVSPLVRGALTAIGWVMGERMGNVTSWPTLDAALREAVCELEACGIQVARERVAVYRRPQRSPSARWTQRGSTGSS